MVGKERKMKIKEAMDSTVRSRHVSTVMECLKCKDGLTFKKLYAEYCKRCKEEGVEPACYSTIHTTVRRMADKGIIRKDYSLEHGKCGVERRIWLVK